MNTKTVGREEKRINVLETPIDRLNTDEVLEAIEAFIKDRTPRMVVTADASGLICSQSDAEFRHIIQLADLVTPDSEGVLWAARRKGTPFPERVSGVDLVDNLCALSAQKGYGVFFLGAAPGVAEMAAEKMKLRHPGCNILGTRHGYFPADSDDVVAREVAEFKPDILFVAMGIPRQEKFIYNTREIIKAPVALGVGGSLDVFSGKAKRAPVFVQKMKLEWLWRLLLNPKKISKCKALPVFVWQVLKSK
jgi:N-acetylglucosaminyldiphosphoundecaprenol N-acetyl-beta-D-mannosaminyltransferase